MFTPLLCASALACGGDPDSESAEPGPAETTEKSPEAKAEATPGETSEDADPKQAAKDRMKARGSQRRTARRRAGVRSRGPRRRFALKDQPPPPPPPGLRLRMFRRPMHSGIIQVREEHLADETSRQTRMDNLLMDGWKRWPPAPAPELASSSAMTDERFVECPYLMESIEEPKDWSKAPKKRLRCFRTITEIEGALQIAYSIAYHRERAASCGELPAFDVDDNSEALEDLRKRCRVMGIRVAKAPWDARKVPSSVQNRTRKNRSRQKKVRQRVKGVPRGPGS